MTDELTYPEVGATAGVLPDGYHHIRESRVLGRGADRFERAADRLMSWDLHRRSGLSVEPEFPTVTLNTWVKVRIGVGPFGVTAPCRVVYVIDEPRRRGFGYGTLAGHPERGEEAFSVEWRDDDVVEVHVVAFSRPATWWAKAGAPAARLMQRLVTRRYLRALEDR